MDRILEIFPYIKNRIINLSEDEWFEIKMTYGDDVIALDIEVPEDSDFISFKGGVLFKLFIDPESAFVGGKKWSPAMLSTGAKLTSLIQNNYGRYCAIRGYPDSSGFRLSAGNFYHWRSTSKIKVMGFNSDVNTFNDFWRITPKTNVMRDNFEAVI